MPDIKTKDVVKGTIKKIDKAAVASQRMKQAYISTKDKAEHSVQPAESSETEYASNKVENTADVVVHETAHRADKVGRWGVRETRKNVVEAKDNIQQFKQKRAAQRVERQAATRSGRIATHGQGTIRTLEHGEKTIKQSASSAGKKTIKQTAKGTAKTTQRAVKTAEQTAKTTIKTTKQAAKAAQKTAQASVKASQKAYQVAKATAKATAATIKAAAKATAAAVKAIIAGVKALVAAIAAGGWVAVAVILVICLIGMIVGSVFGIFFSGEDSGSGMTMRTVVQEINTDYDNKLTEIKSSTEYDDLEMSGSRAVWKEVLAVYAVKINTDPDNPQEVASMDDTKKQLLSDIFWEMNEVSSRTESKTETVIEESDDGNGNIVETETTETKTILYITVSHKTVDEMADQYGFSQEQRDYLAELLEDENNSLWAAALYALCLDGRGPSQIARQLEQEKVLIPTAYYASLGRKTRKQYTDPYAWDQKTVAGILVNQQYTGCTVNFMTTTISYKVHKTVYKPKDEWQIIPNTQPAIIDEDTWKRVQELREHRIRPTATGRTSLFSGKAFCADCGSKLHFCAAKSLNANQEYYRCSNYKSGRGSCQIHFIRNVVLEKIVLEAINSLADFVRCYEPVFLYLMVQKDIVSKRTETSKLKTAIESGKRRIQDLDKLIERIYEDQVLGNISAERYARMSVNYENEQRTLINKVAEDEKKLACIEQTSLDLKTLLKVLRSSTSFDELTPTLVNSLIRRIEVHNNDKSSGHCYVKVDIYFTAIGLIDIPTEDEIKSLMAKIKANPQEYRLTA